MERDFFIKGYQLTKIIFVGSAIMFSQIAMGLTYPLKLVGVPQIGCKGIHWSELPPECKMELPIIQGADYENYKDAGTYRAIYSDIWGSSYVDGWDNLAGGSPGIDIATPEGTPIYAIGDGEVIQSREISGYGKSVTIKHIINGKIYYSSYSHMSKMEVNVGDKVKEGQKIGEVGKTGFTMGRWGYHLDFSISDSLMRTYPYGYVGCKAGYMSAVNDGTCRKELFENTIDPIAFLEFQGDENKIAAFEKNIISSAAVKRVSTAPEKNTAAPVISKQFVSADIVDKIPQPAIVSRKRTISIPSVSAKPVQVAVIPDDSDFKAVPISPSNHVVAEEGHQNIPNNLLLPTKPTEEKEKKLIGSTQVTPMDLDYKLAKIQADYGIKNSELVRINVSKKVLDTSSAVGAGSTHNYSTSEIPVFRDGDLEIKISGLYKKGGLTWIKDKDAQVKVVVNTIGSNGNKTPFDGKLPKPITFKSATSAVFAPYNYTIVENSYMIINLSPIAVGTDSLGVYYGDKLLGTYKVNIK